MLREIAVLAAWLLLAGNGWGDEVEAERFNYDPRLAGEVLPQGPVEPASPLAIDAAVTEGEVRLSTKTPISPYLEAVGGPEPTADELRLLPEEFQRSLLERYQLGAGVGIAVDDKASLSLGYRFQQPLSLLDDDRPATPSTREDLRIFFDVKLPFD